MRKIHLLFLPWVFVFAVGMAFAQKEHNVASSQVVAEIQDKLYHARIPKHGDVQVSFQDGVATLTGTVDCIGVKEDAENATRKVEDVRSIVDDVTVHAEDVTDRQIAEMARKEIVTYPFFTIFDWATLSAQGGSLTVNGQVTESVKKDDIGHFLEHVKGVVSLQNNLEVLPTSIFDDQIRRAVARAIYREPYFVNYANQAIPPIHIIVKNGNVTLEGVVNSEVDKAKAEMDARFAATYYSLTNNLRVEH